MKGPLKLSLAIALALGVADAFALGLGQIQVKSGLNEPLNAEIPVLAGTPGEAVGLHVDLASAEDFARVGLNRAHVTLPLEFSVGNNARGDTVIKISTKEIVREPFLDFLVEVNWAKGKLLREYTVLLDPPVMAPAVKGSAVTSSAPVKDHEAAVAQKLPEEKPAKGKGKQVNAAKAEAPKPVAAKPAPAEKPKSKPAVAAHPAGANDYGPVAQGETLSEIARATRPDEATNFNKMMLALLKANPNAFYKDNINALKRGAILRIPTPDEIKATGSLSEVAAAVHSQNAAWAAGSVSSKPTLLADTGASTVASKPVKDKAKGKAEKVEKPIKTDSAKDDNERLALVPPRVGKDSLAKAERPGASGSGSANTPDTKAELARTKESLTAREQEASELKSRVKELEDIKGKSERLITFKDSEIAELQRKLKELQDESKKPATVAAPAATKPVESSGNKSSDPAASKPADSTKPVDATRAGQKNDKLTATEIWGDTGTANDKTATATKPAATASGSNPVSANPSTDAASTATGSTNAATATPSPATDSPAATTTENASTGTAVPPASTTTPIPPSETPATTKLSPAPIAPPEPPWYLDPVTLYAGGGGLLLLGLLAMLKFMRRPKPMPALGMDDSFDEEHESEQAPHPNIDEEHALIDQINRYPHDAALHLELLNFYYAHRDTAKFEEAAEAMYGNIADPTQPEWQHARTMGEELAPHNPLFGGEPDLSAMAGSNHHETETDYTHTDFSNTTTEPHAQMFHFDETDEPAAKSDRDDFDFALTDAPPSEPARPAHDDLSFDLPVSAPARAEPASAPARAPFPVKPTDDEFFAAEDAIGTKLDLAKAYLDMGDPEGARSMLEEVLNEGNDEQKKEARKLIADIK